MNALRNRALLLFALTVSLAVTMASLASPRPAQAQEAPVKITVKVTDGGFDPLVVEVEQGKSVELTFVWAHVVHQNEEHIMVIPGYKLESDKIDSSHRETTVKFIAMQSGTFDYKCDLECETHDILQNGVIKVKPSGGGAAAALQPSKLVVDPVSGILIKGGTVSLAAALQDKDGNPIPKAEVSFYVEQKFLGDSGLMAIGVAKTGASGYANLLYRPTTNAPRTIVTKFAGLGLYDATEQKIELVGSDQFIPKAAEAPDDTLHGLKGGARIALVVVIAGVWLAFAFMLFQAAGIRRETGGGGIT